MVGIDERAHAFIASGKSSVAYFMLVRALPYRSYAGHVENASVLKLY